MPVMRFYQAIGKLLTAALKQINQQCKKLTKKEENKGLNNFAAYRLLLTNCAA